MRSAFQVMVMLSSGPIGARSVGQTDPRQIAAVWGAVDEGAQAYLVVDVDLTVCRWMLMLLLTVELSNGFEDVVRAEVVKAR